MHRGTRGILAVVLASIDSAPATGLDHPMIRVEVQHVGASPYAMKDSGVAAFSLKFDIMLTNQSEKTIYIPNPVTVQADATRIAVLGVQGKDPHGTWKYILQSSWYGYGVMKYEACASLLPGAVTKAEDVSYRLVVLRGQLADLGNEPGIRLDLWTFCRQPDGKVLTNSATTDPFTLRFPVDSQHGH